MKYRTFGWVQNPSDFEKLKKTVEVFDPSSNQYAKLKRYIIQDVIFFDEDKKRLQSMLDNEICEFSYYDLVGTSVNKKHKSPRRRSDAVANSLLQITLLPQSANTKGKLYTDNWTSDGYLRWAVSLGFVRYNRETDTFSITESGKKLSKVAANSTEEHNILINALLGYPPATRVLSLLAESKRSLTKFYIGNQLGFVGEKGFSSYDESLMIDWLKSTNSKEEQKKIRSDVEGTSDKYARMIANWLSKLGLVKKTTSKYQNFQGNDITGFQEFSITGPGLHAFNQSIGSSKKTVKTKFIMWEFLAIGGKKDNEQTRDFIRTRRALTIKLLKNHHTIDSLLNALKNSGIPEEKETLIADLNKLISFGLRIKLSGNKVSLLDKIHDFSIPNQTFTPAESDISSEKLKNHFRRITDLPEKYINLLDIAFDKDRNRDFEIITASLFKEGYGLSSIHLGGQNKPDGVIYNDNFGIILDTKAYGKGYGKYISQIDEMVRYIQDNQERDTFRNPNRWWENFSEFIPKDSYYYLWVSGKFLPTFTEQLKQTNHRSHVNGGGLEVQQLLLGADAVMKGNLDVNDLPKYMKNEVIRFSSSESKI